MKLPWRKPPRTALTPSEFWQWVTANKARIESIGPQSAKLVHEVGDQLARVSDRVVFECGRGAGGVFEFVISADGIEDEFPEVHRVVAEAPAIPGWRIVAFRPREPIGRIAFRGITLSPDTLRFRVLGETPNGNPHILIFIPGLTPRNRDMLVQATFLILDKVLGEYDVVKSLGAIRFESLDRSTPQDMPLSMLQTMVDARKPDGLANPS